MAEGDFAALPDLAVRPLGGSVVAASDESFAVKENLINPWAPAFRPETFGPRGQEYDGWETRRRRPDARGELGHDWAVVRLGVPGVIRGVVIDTAWFKGNFPPVASVEACAAEGYAAPDELTGWVEIVPRSPLGGDRAHAFPVEVERRFTHVRLNIHPDGGVARLRVHGEPVPDPALLDGLTVDLAALENGARVTACSDEFYSSPAGMLMPGLARTQAEGWETARRRGGGNDWAVIALAAAGTVRLAEIDTSNLRFNAPGWAALSGMNAHADPDAWFPLLERTRLQPDLRHRFRLADAPETTHVRLDIYPDGGLARLRLLGDLSPAGERALRDRWTRLTG
ncbi:allantoicase [Thermomonospora cellulosilytica]|uniref:Probable allantoicase n=1 Tax=Thermomonospora cellulosilytica TaxID=1411118 RepID=A0A7W3N4H9_9ACTN|nr:allantoicase [Thermomonospora cellulosilytica]MBA9007406.1 allantoicase [Thermomonospora cellulosilytica]